MPLRIVDKCIYSVSLLVIFSLVGGGIFAVSKKPEFKHEYFKTDKQTLVSQINSQSIPPTLNFAKDHEIQINGQTKAIWNNYIIRNTDLNEGENIIKFRRRSDQIVGSGIGEWVEYKITVDRVAPELKLTQNIPSFIQLDSFVNIQLESETEAKLFLNDIQSDQFTTNNLTLQQTLVDGKNTFTFTSKDNFGNTSNPVQISTDAFIRKNWEKLPCDQVTFAFDTNKLQVGYSGFSFLPDGFKGSKMEKDAQIFLDILSQCTLRPESPNYPQRSVHINTLGENLPCTACDAGLPFYIQFSSSKGSILNDQKATIIENEPYTTKSGIPGKIITFRGYRYGLGDTSKIYPFVYLTQLFEFESNGKLYEISAKLPDDKIEDYIEQNPEFVKRYKQQQIHDIGAKDDLIGLIDGMIINK